LNENGTSVIEYIEDPNENINALTMWKLSALSIISFIILIIFIGTSVIEYFEDPNENINALTMWELSALSII